MLKAGRREIVGVSVYGVFPPELLTGSLTMV